MFSSAQEVLDLWVKGVNAGEADKVLELYNSEAVLLPTFSNKTLNTPAGIKDYFEQLSSRKNLSVEQHDKHFIVHVLTPTVSSLSGIYRWQFEVEDDAMTFEARFTFTIDTSLEAPIVHHHSSQVPRML